jgi:hypothetical protein
MRGDRQRTADGELKTSSLSGDQHADYYTVDCEATMHNSSAPHSWGARVDTGPAAKRRVRHKDIQF